jgi:hypothetical protein
LHTIWALQTLKVCEKHVRTSHVPASTTVQSAFEVQSLASPTLHPPRHAAIPTAAMPPAPMQQLPPPSTQSAGFSHACWITAP